MDPYIVTLGLFATVVVALLGALIGSFANVVIYRLPRQESIAFPGSHCPGCSRPLTPLELVPVLSWAFQGGRCRGCAQVISPRYPLVELLMAAGFLAVVLRWPLIEYGATAVPLLLLLAVLLILAFIDLDTFTLPDVLTIPGTLVALAATWFYAADSGLPSLNAALAGAAVGAGVLVLINRLGGLVLRRFADTAERLNPIGFDQVNLAALGGALLGWQAGLLLAGASFVINLFRRAPLRLPEPVLYALWLLALLLAALDVTIPVFVSLTGSLVAAGAAAFAGGVWWWLADLFTRSVSAEPVALPDRAAAAAALTDEDEEPVAMGFGDVKLAALTGSLLGWEKLLLSVLLAVVTGAMVGVAGRLLGGSRVIPFGPYLVLGALLALFFGDALLGWYLQLLGF